MPGGGTATRDYVRHVGAVAVVALDDAGQVVLIRQYRHPVGRHLWELPAGLMDVDGEDLAGGRAPGVGRGGRPDRRRGATLLVDLHSSPGFSDELVRVFLARDLAEVPAEQRHERHDEEADLQVVRIDLDEAVAHGAGRGDHQRVLRGRAARRGPRPRRRLHRAAPGRRAAAR